MMSVERNLNEQPEPVAGAWVFAIEETLHKRLSAPIVAKVIPHPNPVGQEFCSLILVFSICTFYMERPLELCQGC